MPQYNDQQARLARSFECERTMCWTVCHCGRKHFVSSENHGDYQPGELEELQRKAEVNPDKFVEHGDYDYIDEVWIDGKQIVLDCPCEKYKRYCDWIEENAEELAKYLGDFLEDRRKEAARIAEESAQLVAGLFG